MGIIIIALLFEAIGILGLGISIYWMTQMPALYEIQWFFSIIGHGFLIALSYILLKGGRQWR
jgi:hypothetical protein